MRRPIACIGPPRLVRMELRRVLQAGQGMSSVQMNTGAASLRQWENPEYLILKRNTAEFFVGICLQCT